MTESVQLAEFIRETSSDGELVASADVEAHIVGQTIPVSEQAMDLGQILTLIQETIANHSDIKVVSDDSGDAWYFSDRFMTSAYAGILLLKAKGPLKMLAEVIREHSRLYPRPVPHALFQCSPFNLSNEEIALCMKEMMDTLPYRDIAHVTTSIGTQFAYSTDYLDPGHAAMLAEWADVGQVENP